eukprot:6214540-Pleurochrysis_carterae.AAC.8
MSWTRVPTKRGACRCAKRAARGRSQRWRHSGESSAADARPMRSEPRGSGAGWRRTGHGTTRRMGQAHEPPRLANAHVAGRSYACARGRVRTYENAGVLRLSASKAVRQRVLLCALALVPSSENQNDRPDPKRSGVDELQNVGATTDALLHVPVRRHIQTSAHEGLGINTGRHGGRKGRRGGQVRGRGGRVEWTNVKMAAAE